MNRARVLNTDEIVYAETLLEFHPNYKELEFVCLDEQCSVRMAPACIYKKSHRKPHFKKYRNKEHTETCTYSTLNELYELGKNQKLSQNQIKKIGYPSVFNINDEANQIDDSKKSNSRLDNDDEGITGRGKMSSAYEFDSENIKFDRKNRVQGIDRIVDWYLGFPNNRDVEIEVKEVKIQYRYFFKRIGRNTDPLTLQNERIFYGRLRLSNTNKDAFDKYKNKVFFTLLGYKPNIEGSGKLDNYSIKIDKSLNSNYTLSRLKNKYNFLFEKAMNDLQNQSVDPNIGLYFFAFGTIDERNDSIINVNRHHITFRYDEVRKTVIED